MKLNYDNRRIEKQNDNLITVLGTTTMEEFFKKCQTAKNKNKPIDGLYLSHNNFADVNYLSRVAEMFAYLKDHGFGGECIIETYPNREFSSKEMEMIIRLDGMLAKQFPVQDDCAEGSLDNFSFKPNFLYGRAPQDRKYKNIDFETNGILWSVDEILFLNNLLDRAVKSAEGLSPLEKVAYFYTWVTDFQYRDLDRNSDFGELAHTVYGLFGHGYAVCETLANMFEMLCSRAGIKCLPVEKELYKGREYGHLANAVYISDSKYGVEGYYHLDPSNDARYSGEDYQSCSFFMSPVKYTEDLYENQYRDMLVDLSRPQNYFETLQVFHKRGGLGFLPFVGAGTVSAVERALAEHKNLSKTKGLSKEQVSQNRRRQKQLERFCRAALDEKLLFDSPRINPDVIEKVMKNVLSARLAGAKRDYPDKKIIKVLETKCSKFKMMRATIDNLDTSIDEFILEEREKRRSSNSQSSKKNNKGKGKGKKKDRFEELDGQHYDDCEDESQG